MWPEGGAALIGGPRLSPSPHFRVPPPSVFPLAGGDKGTVGINSPKAVGGGGGGPMGPCVPFVLWGCSQTPAAPSIICSSFRGAAEAP